MDDVIADFYKGSKHHFTGKVMEERMFDKHFFLNLEPVPGSKAAIFQLIKMGFDVWILSQPLVQLPESYIEKVEWIQRHFPALTSKIILTQDKGLNLGHYLIDDNKNKWQQKFEQNGGKFIHFKYGGYNYPDMQDPRSAWEDIVFTMSSENPYTE